MCTRFRALSATETARARGSSHRARARPRPVASGVQSGAHSAAGWRTTSTMTCRIVEQVVLILRRAGAAVHEPGREALHAARPAAGAAAAAAHGARQHQGPAGEALPFIIITMKIIIIIIIIIIILIINIVVTDSMYILRLRLPKSKAVVHCCTAAARAAAAAVCYFDVVFCGGGALLPLDGSAYCMAHLCNMLPQYATSLPYIAAAPDRQ